MNKPNTRDNVRESVHVWKNGRDSPIGALREFLLHLASVHNVMHKLETTQPKVMYWPHITDRTV